MNIELDYISVTLTDKFTWHDWLEYAEQPVFHEGTGLIVGQKVPKKSYKLDIIYKHWVLSAYGPYAIELASMAIHFGLEPTRLDIKLDCEIPDNLTSETLQANLVTSVKHALQTRKSRRKHKYYVQPGKDGAETRTDYFGARESDSQLRIYGRKKIYSTEPAVRIEWQLRGELAKSAWPILAKGFFKQSRLADVMASLETMVLLPGTFGIDWQNEKIYELDRSKDKVNSSRKDWIATQVLSACLKEFNETGENLAQFLLNEFNRHLIEKGKEQAEWQASKQKILEKALNIFS